MKRTVIKARNPMNPLRWNCELDCGHEVWVTAKRAPKKATCSVKACGVVRR